MYRAHVLGVVLTISLAQQFVLAGGRTIKLGYLYIQGGPSAANGYGASWIQESFSQFKLGIQDVNADPSTLPNDTLTFDLWNTQGDQGVALRGAIKMLSGGAVGIVGTGYSSAARASAVYCSSMEKPMVSPGSTATDLIDKSTFPYFFRSIASDGGMLKGLVALVWALGWRRAAPIVNSALEPGAVQVLRPALEASSIGYLMLVYADVEDSEGRIVEDARKRLDDIMKLVKSSGYRVIISYPKTIDATHIKRSAEAGGVGLWDTRYVWVMSSTAWDGGMDQGVQGLAVYPLPQTSARQTWYNNRWPQVAKRWNETRDGGYNATTGMPFFGPDAVNSTTVWDTDYAPVGDGLPDYWGTFVYDAVWLYAYALDALIKAGKSPNDGAALRTALLGTRFDGITGEMFFDRSSQDRMIPLVILMSNGTGGSRRLGEGTDNLTNWALQGPCLNCTSINVTSIKWPRGRLPTDGRMLDTGKSTIVLAGAEYLEGSPISFVVQALDSFGRPPCQDVCPATDVDQPCGACLSDLAAVADLRVSLEDDARHVTLRPIGQPVFAQRPATGQIEVHLPFGIAGADASDRQVQLAVLFRGTPVQGDQLIALHSTACPSGQAGPDGSCVRCGRGTFSSARGQSACDLCAAGRHQPEEGATECRACELGRSLAARGGADCADCKVGTYADAPGAVNCTRCGEGRPSQSRWSTMQMIESEWVHAEGSSNESACGCDRGSRLLDGECVPCGEGMECAGMGEVQILSGYASGAEVSVFVCFGDHRRCPGGPPGRTCAHGRVGRSCEACENGMTPAGDGGCAPCGGTDVLPVVCVAIAWVAALVFVYVLVDRQVGERSSFAASCCAIAVSQFASLLQQMAVFGIFAVSWPDPLGSFLKVIQLFVFDINVLRLGCVVTDFGELARFLAKIGIIVVNLAAMAVIHTIYVSAFHRRRFSLRMATLIGAEGTVLMVFYTSIVTVILGPVQCLKHPNGIWTSRAYQGVVCWDSSSKQHIAMVVVAAVALAIPVAFTARCIVVVVQFAERMRRLDIGFLKAHQFLFARFKPQAHWYVLVMIGKSFGIAVLPVVSHAVAQILILQALLIISLLFAVTAWPWRVPLTNVVDLLTTALMLLAVNVASFCVDQPSPTETAWVCVFCMAAALAPLPVLIMQVILKRIRARAKAYQFFLCHHKAGAGAFCRLLKMQLVDASKGAGDVFLDSDNLFDLDKLFDCVAHQLDTLVIVGSGAIYLRPWCVGEMTTAYLKKVPTALVALPDYAAPSEDFITQYEERMPDLDCLVEHGIALPDVKDALRWLSGHPAIEVPAVLGNSVVEGLANMLRSRRTGSISEPPPVDPVVDVLILADGKNLEAVAAAHVLQRILAAHLTGSVSPPAVVRHVDEVEWGSAQSAVVLCTSGCLLEAAFLEMLVLASNNKLSGLPVVADIQFSFPTKAFYESIIDSPPLFAISTMEDFDPAVVPNILASLFKEIALQFIAQHASYNVLQLGAVQVAARLLKGAVRNIRSSGRSITNRHSSSSQSCSLPSCEFADADSVNGDVVEKVLF